MLEHGAEGSFGFMESDVSSEKPQAVLVRQVADGMREAKAAGKKVLWVGGPGVVHTGAAPAMVALVDAGFVDVLFAGNALATHDIESALYGTSLGVDLAQGRGVEHGHEHHIRALNTIRKAGSIAAAVDTGVLTGGIMHALVTHDKEFVLVGSVRDDGPLPDVYTDVIEGQRAMRAKLTDVGFCLMVATMLHSVATGNILPGLDPAGLRRHQPGDGHQARRPRLLPGARHRHRRRAVPRAARERARARLPARPEGLPGARSAAPIAPACGPSAARTTGGTVAVRGTDQSSRASPGPGRFEQQVAGGGHPAADDDASRGRRPPPGWPARRRATRRPSAKAASASGSPAPAASVDHRSGHRGRVTPAGLRQRTRLRSCSRPRCSRTNRTSALPLVYCSQQPRAPALAAHARRARPACGRTPRPCRWRHGAPRRRAPARRRCRSPA